MEDRGGGREVVDDSSTGTRAWSSRERISSGRIQPRGVSCGDSARIEV